MKPLSYIETLRAIADMAHTIQQQHLNHERRNERLSNLRSLIEWSEHSFRSYPSIVDQCQALRTCKLLAIWQLDHESHNEVKSRLRLLEEFCGVAVQRELKREKEDRAHHRIESSWRDRITGDDPTKSPTTEDTVELEIDLPTTQELEKEYEQIGEEINDIESHYGQLDALWSKPQQDRYRALKNRAAVLEKALYPQETESDTDKHMAWED